MITTFTLMGPIELFESTFLIEKPSKLIEKLCKLAQKSRKYIQKLDAEQKASLKISLEKGVTKWKNCYKWREWSPNTKGPLFVNNKFALPKTIPRIKTVG